MLVGGHHAHAIQIGGATSQIGDPTDRLTSRQAVKNSVQNHNFHSVSDQVKRLWPKAEKRMQSHGIMQEDRIEDHKEGGSRRQILNNADWLEKLSILDFVKYMGSGARMGTMLGRDT